MGVSEEVKFMQSKGVSDPEIVQALTSKGYQEREVYDSLTQAKIKEAIVSSGSMDGKTGPDYLQTPSSNQYSTQSSSISGNYEGMQPSMFVQQSEQQNTQSVYSNSQSQSSQPEQEYVGEPYGGNSYVPETQTQQSPEQYQSYQDAFSSDMITEIAEQVVSERLTGIQEKLEKNIDFRTVAEARILGLDRRLRRIEQIIDKLQLSVLQRVGEYVNDVKDLKNELGETQKSFKAISEKRHEHHATHHEHHTVPHGNQAHHVEHPAHSKKKHKHP
ncbi:MAG: hypothetical protein AABY10_03745 [Nanoarchaeota archaeon]